MSEPTQDKDKIILQNSSFGFPVCPYCASKAGFDYVHGHYQCKQCKQNAMPCCGGEVEDINN